MVLARMTVDPREDDALSRWSWMRADPDSGPLAAWLSARAEELAEFRAEPEIVSRRERAAEALRSATAEPQQGAPITTDAGVFSLDRLLGAAHRTVMLRTPGQAEGRAVLDGSAGVIDWFQPSRSGRKIVIGRSASGSERSIGSVIDVESGRTMPDRLDGVRHACIAWMPDEQAFIYSRYPDDRAYGRELWLHRLGDPQHTDSLVWQNEADSTDWPDIEVSEDGSLALVHVSVGWRQTDVHLLDVRTGDRTALVTGHDALTRLHFTESGAIVGVTGVGAPRGRLVLVDPTLPGPEHWYELLAEGEIVLEDCSARDDGVFLVGEAEMSGAVGFLPIRSEPSGMRAAGPAAWAHLGVGDLAIGWPTPGRSMMRDRVVQHLDHRTAVFSWSSMTAPALLHIWTPGERPLPLDDSTPRLGDTQVRALSVPASDGESIPILILEPAGTAAEALPTLLHGYGGFGLSSTGGYTDVGRAWALLGGRYVVAGIRGGRERGSAWHAAGRLQQRQRVFDDFADVADGLVRGGICVRERLAVWGSSNGGLLIAATVVQRPGLCAAAHAAVPMTDMLGYHRLSIARLWSGDFGDPEDQDARAWIRDYSPLHNLPTSPADLPDLIVTTGRNDTRVAPFHSYAFVEALRERRRPGSFARLLLAEDLDGGHGIGKPTDAFVTERADVFALFQSAFDRRSGGRERFDHISDSDSL